MRVLGFWKPWASFELRLEGHFNAKRLWRELNYRLGLKRRPPPITAADVSEGLKRLYAPDGVESFCMARNSLTQICQETP